MSTSLITPAQWAQREFALAQLGDQRRTKRLINIATKLAANPGGTLPQAFGHWDELKAAYRFFSQPGNGDEQILAPHLERTRAQCRQPGEYLLIEDTSDLDYSHHPLTEQLGVIGDGRGRGLRLHSTLALRVEAWNLEQRPEAVVVGLMHQHCWAQRNRSQGRRRDQPLTPRPRLRRQTRPPRPQRRTGFRLAGANRQKKSNQPWWQGQFTPLI